MNIEEVKTMDFYDWCGIDSVFLDTLEKKIEFLEYLGIKITK